MSFNWIKQDEVKRKEGVWDDHEAGRFKIASPNQFEINQAVEKFTLEVQKQNEKAKDKQAAYKPKPSELYMISMKVIAETKLLDWEIEGIEYSFDNAVNALLNDSEFVKYVSEKSAENGSYLKESKEKPAKK